MMEGPEESMSRAWFPVILVSCAWAGLLSSAVMAESRNLNGTVTYRERIALPPSAVVEVKLVDVSRADAPSQTIAETSIRPAGQVPVSWQLRFDDADITPGRRYALQARISVDGELWFITTTHHPVLAGGPDKTGIVVQRVARQSDIPLTPVGRWLAEDIRGGGVIDRLQTVLEIAADGTVSGTGGCNRMAGKATISNDKLAFSPLASTNMACTPAAMAQEQKFLAALGEVRSWRVDPAQKKLTLLGADGGLLVVFTQMG